MPNPYVYDGDGYRVGTWDKTNGILETEHGPDMTVEDDGTVLDSSGNYVGHIDSRGRLS